MNDSRAGQSGATLVIALAILSIVSLLALSGMREVALETRLSADAIDRIGLQNAAESGLREGERRFVNAPRPPEPGTGCAAGNTVQPCLLNLAALGVKLADAQQNPVGALKGRPPIWRHYRGSDIASATSADRRYSVRWNSIGLPSGGPLNEAENPEYGNPMRGIGIFYYGINSVARNPANDEIVLQSVIAHLYTH